MMFVAVVAALMASCQLEVHAFAPTSSTFKRANQVLIGTSRPLQVPELLHQNVDKRQSLSTLFMGWGPEPEWSGASIAASNPASSSGNFVTVAVDVPSSLVEEYKVPGQYVQVKQSIDDEEAKPIFLAIASPPVSEGDDAPSNTIEFLIKKTDNNDWITDAVEGTQVAVSQVMGGGFPIAEECDGFKYDFPVQNCLLFANGSGIAPIRAAIESGQLKIGKPGQGGRTARLYYGCTTPSDMPYISKFKEWEMSGFEVVPVVSQPENCQGQWGGRTGYVQTCLEEDGVPIPRNTGALMCGVKGMAESVKDLLTKAGVFEGRVMTNF